jgi:recombination protein RecT
MSTPQNVSTSLATNKPAEVVPLFDMLNKPEILKRFELACGAQAGSVMTNIINAANSNPDILRCEPMSVITAGLNAAAMKLSLAKSLGQACILPFDKYKKNGGSWEVISSSAELIVMVRGIKDMAMRTNKYRVLNSFTVYEGQDWEENQMTGIGKIIGKRTGNNPVGYGAYLLLFTGYEATKYMSVDEILTHAARFSKSWDKDKKSFKPKSKWETDFDTMAEKTVLKWLIMNKGVINDSDRAILDAVEDSAHGEIVDTGPDLGELDALEGQAEAITEPVTPAPVSPEELAYLDALEVKTPMGARMGDKSQGELTAIAKRTDHPESAKAAQIILDWRKAKEARDLAQLGF